LDSKAEYLLFKALFIFFLLSLFSVSEGFSIKRTPGRKVFPGLSRPGIENLALPPAQGGQNIPGLFELVPFGSPEAAVWPALLYHPSQEAVSGESDYFAKRIEVPVQGSFLVLGIGIMVPPKAQGEIVPFPEVLLAPEAAEGGPDLARAFVSRQMVSPEPGSSALLVDLSDAELVFLGPEVLYVVVRFPSGAPGGAQVMLDTDADAGLFPGTSFVSRDGIRFLSFEEAAAKVRPFFYGLEQLDPPGLAGDALAFELIVYTEASTVPPVPPTVEEIDLSSSGALRVRLTIPPFLADGQQLARSPGWVVVTHYSPEFSADSLIDVLPVETDGWIEISNLQPRPYLLRFASLLDNNLLGIFSGCIHLMPEDPYEPDDSRQSAASLTWRYSPGKGRFEALSEAAQVAHAVDFDFYRVELAKGDSLVADLGELAASYSRLDPLLSLVDSSGTVLAHAEGIQAAVGLTAPYSGVYYLLVNDRAILQGASFSVDGSRTYRLQAKRLNRRGDLDGNGRLDYRDAFLVFLLTRGFIDTLEVSPLQRLAADFDADGRVAGDLDDFLLLLRTLAYIPSRDPNRPDKSKLASPEAQLAALSGEGWRLELSDGSALRLFLHQEPQLDSPGPQAEALLALLGHSSGETAARSVLPRTALLKQNVPNPFNPSTEIAFELPAPGWASLEIFDILGRRVRSLFKGWSTAGIHRFTWDGTDYQGRMSASGVYFYRLQAAGISITRKMLLLK